MRVIRKVYLRRNEVERIRYPALERLLAEGFEVDISTGGNALVLSFSSILWREKNGLFYPRKWLLSPKEWECALRSLDIEFFPKRPAK